MPDQETNGIGCTGKFFSEIGLSEESELITESCAGFGKEGEEVGG